MLDGMQRRCPESALPLLLFRRVRPLIFRRKFGPPPRGHGATIKIKKNKMSTEKKTRTITLTGRAPVKIDEDSWSVIARAAKDRDRNNQELSRRYYLTVRQHADGRAIVYGIFSTSCQGEDDKRAGRVVSNGKNVAATIAEVGGLIGAPESVIDQCIADLPPEELS